MISSSLTRVVLLVILLALLAFFVNAPAADKGPVRVELKENEARGQLQVLIDGTEAVGYQYKGVDLPHFYPVYSPSGKLLTVAKTEPYPHHRSLWFADTVVLEGRRQASFYNALYTQTDHKDPKSPFRDHIRHLQFPTRKAAGTQAEYEERLLWEMDLKVPVLDEERHVRVVVLDRGQYFLDLRFTVTASYGDVTFTSDGAHYAWPYVRMHPQFSVDRGGTMISSDGGVNQQGTNNRRARWVDYSNTIDGVSEGLAFFVFNPDEPAPLWLTRDYGTFGPRRGDAQNGKPFELKKGQSLRQHVGILVHTGDAQTAGVARRYRELSRQQ